MSDEAKKPTLAEWKSKLKEDLGEDAVSFGGADLGKFSSGIFSLDRALGDGWSYGLYHLLVGYESCGKSTIATKSAGEMNKINMETGKLDLSYSNPCPVLWVDQEGTFSEEWASKNGFLISRPQNEVVQLSDGQKMVDVVNSAILSELFCLIVIDSLESTMSQKVAEQSASDSYVGDRARILNDGYRRWTTSRVSMVSKFRDKPWRIPTIIAINQMREKIGVMYGDPSTIPGGIGQRMYSSTIIRMYNAKVENDNKTGYGMGTFSGITQKNKTAPPKRNFSFDMAIIDNDKLTQGEVDNAAAIFSDARDSGLLFKDGNSWRFGDETFRVQGDFKDKLYADPAYLASVWKTVLGASHAVSD